MARKPSAPPPDECANCGADIPRNAHACPDCGADERTGWRESSVYDGLDLPDSAYDDADENSGDDLDDDGRPSRANGKNETPSQRARRVVRERDIATQRRGELPWYWLIVGAVLLGILVLGSLALLR